MNSRSCCVGVVVAFLLLSVSRARVIPVKAKEDKGGAADHRQVMEQMQRLREAFQMGDEKEYRRYWRELMESSPGKKSLMISD